MTPSRAAPPEPETSRTAVSLRRSPLAASWLSRNRGGPWYRKFSAQQKLEASSPGSAATAPPGEVRREHEIAETLYDEWRDKLIEGS